METNITAAEELMKLIDVAEFTPHLESPLKLWELKPPYNQSCEEGVWLGDESKLADLLCGAFEGLPSSVCVAAAKLVEMPGVRCLLRWLESIVPGRVQKRHSPGAKYWQIRSASKPVVKTGVELIAEERERQLSEEGWTPEHDDHHSCGELLDAALSYGHAAINSDHPSTVNPPQMWPWEAEWWMPSKDRIRNLTKMGALVAAEIDRLNRVNSK